MILENNLIVTSLVVIAKVVGLLRATSDLVGSKTKEVNLFVVQNLSLLIVCKLAHEKL